MDRRPGEAADPEEPERRSLFAERRIDGVWRKWNTNFGATVKTAASPEMAVGTDGAAAPGGASGADEQQPIILSSDDVPFLGGTLLLNVISTGTTPAMATVT